MADESQDWVFRLYETDPSVSHFSEAKLRSALDGFLPQRTKTDAWLAAAIRWAVHTALRWSDSQASKKGVAEVRDELRDHAAAVRELWLRLNSISAEADAAMWNFSFRRWVAAPETLPGATMNDGPDIEALRDLRGRLQQLGHYLGAVADDQDGRVPPGKWITQDRMRVRIMLARFLAVVFEEAFSIRATFKNGGTNDRPETYGAWPQFYCLVLNAAGVQGASTNLGDVLKLSRALHLRERVEFNPDWFSE